MRRGLWEENGGGGERTEERKRRMGSDVSGGEDRAGKGLRREGYALEGRGKEYGENGGK